MMLNFMNTQVILMTKDEILQLVKEHFDEEWCEEDGHGWVEFAGKPDAFVKFYRKAYSEGWREGNDDGMNSVEEGMV